MSYEIQSNIPVPTGRVNSLPLDKMKKGDSFFVPKTELDYSRLRTRATYYQTVARGTTFSIRRVTENNVEGCRIWRVS